MSILIVLFLRDVLKFSLNIGIEYFQFFNHSFEINIGSVSMHEQLPGIIELVEFAIAIVKREEYCRFERVLLLVQKLDMILEHGNEILHNQRNVQ